MRRALHALPIALIAGMASTASAQPAAPPPAPAASTTDIEDQDLGKLMGLSLGDKLGSTEAVSRKSESVLTAPAAMTVIDANRIGLSGERTFPDLLRWVPGVQVFQTGPGNYTVSLRGTGGLTGNNAVVLVDGIPINNPLDGSVDWNSIPVHPADVDRIEVVRGPVSTIYGANAYTGVINIVTRETIAEGASGAVRTESGFDSQSGRTTASSGRVEYSGRRLRLGLYGTAGYDRLDAQSGDVTQEPSRTAGALAKLQWMPGEHTTLRLEAGASHAERSSLEHLVLESVPQSRDRYLGALTLQIDRVAAWLPSVSLWGRSAGSAVNTDAAEYRGFSYAGTSGLDAQAGTDVTFGLPAGISITAGGNAGTRYVDAPYIHPNADRRAYGVYGVYGSAGLTAQRWSFNAAARADNAPLNGRVEESYRGSVVYHTDDSALRLSAGSAYRAPTYVESVGRFQDPKSMLILLEGRPEVLSPRIDSVEAGAILGLTPTLTISPSVYLAQLSDIMVENFTSLVRKTYETSDHPRTLAGIELEAGWHYRDWLSLDVTGALIEWLNGDDPVTTTVGMADQNSTFVGSAFVKGRPSDRTGYGLGVLYSTGRQYDVRAGIPLQVIDTAVPDSLRGEAMVEWRPHRVPLWVSLRLRSTVPSSVVESPLPGAGAQVTSAMLGLEYRGE